MKLFNVYPVSKPKGNLFDLSHEKKISFNMGDLIPCYIQDVVPGDKFRVNSEVMLRLAPMLAPIMHRVNVYLHFFFVPNRLLWTSWEDFITGGPDGTSAPVHPYYKISTGGKAMFYKGTLADYLGLPMTTSGTTASQECYFNTLPFRAYQMIYNEYYRDPNLTTELNLPLSASGEETVFSTVLYVLRKRCWEKDYFTSALPWTQRGGDVNLPITGDIEFVPDYLTISVAKQAGGSATADGNIKTSGGNLQDVSSNPSRIENLDSSTIYNLENVGLTINDLRQSVKLQEWLEKNARGGGRYIEQILAHFGVMSSDQRLQRPEYLGGGKSPVVISEVLATADGASNDIGDMFGHGISVGNTNQFTKFFEEHGYVMGIISVLPRTAYQQGCERFMLQKNSKFDYYFPEFANLGEQAILNQEIYHDFGGTKTDSDTFGYQSRYAEYKFKQSRVHGDFKDNLTYWHMGRIFSSGPTLNTSFVEADPTHRIFCVTSTNIHKIYGQIYHNVKAFRPMPLFGIPRL